MTLCEVENREGEKKRVFMEQVYRSSKWWEVKDWGESVSELMIKKKHYIYKTIVFLNGGGREWIND